MKTLHIQDLPPLEACHPNLQLLARVAQFKLNKNRHKPCGTLNPDDTGRTEEDWRNASPDWVFRRIIDELGEVSTALSEFHTITSMKVPEYAMKMEIPIDEALPRLQVARATSAWQLLFELSDVNNFLMMLGESCRAFNEATLVDDEEAQDQISGVHFKGVFEFLMDSSLHLAHVPVEDTDENRKKACDVVARDLKPIYTRLRELRQKFTHIEHQVPNSPWVEPS